MFFDSLLGAASQNLCCVLCVTYWLYDEWGSRQYTHHMYCCRFINAMILPRVHCSIVFHEANNTTFSGFSRRSCIAESLTRALRYFLVLWRMRLPTMCARLHFWLHHRAQRVQQRITRPLLPLHWKGIWIISCFFGFSCRSCIAESLPRTSRYFLVVWRMRCPTMRAPLHFWLHHRAQRVQQQKVTHLLHPPRHRKRKVKGIWLYHRWLTPSKRSFTCKQAPVYY